MPHDCDATEQELLAIRCQLGEPDAFEDLVARWHVPMWQFVRRMADHDELTDDLIQETWLRVLRGIAKLEEPAKIVAWMFGIARHVMMDRLRQKYRQEALLESALVDLRGSADESDEFERRDDIANVLNQLDCLPLAQRELLTLYYLDELTIEEVAHVLGIPSGTVKSRLYHARRNLKEALVNKETSR